MLPASSVNNPRKVLVSKTNVFETLQKRLRRESRLRRPELTLSVEVQGGVGQINLEVV